MKKELEQKRDDLKAQLKEVKKQIKELDKPVDVWVVNPHAPYFIGLYSDGVFKLGIDALDKWFFGSQNGLNSSSNDRLATPEEVTKRLTEFVNGLGYVEGVKVLTPNQNLKHTLNDIDIDFCTLDNYKIWYGGCVIWSSKNGWAKIVPKFQVELIRKESSGLTVIEITHDSSVNSDELVKRIENFLNQ